MGGGGAAGALAGRVAAERLKFAAKNGYATDAALQIGVLAIGIADFHAVTHGIVVANCIIRCVIDLVGRLVAAVHRTENTVAKLRRAHRDVGVAVFPCVGAADALVTGPRNPWRTGRAGASAVQARPKAAAFARRVVALKVGQASLAAFQTVAEFTIKTGRRCVKTSRAVLFVDAEIENADVAGAPVEVAALAMRIVLALDARVGSFVAVIGAASPPGTLRSVGAVRAGVATANAKSAVRRLNEDIATCSRVAAPRTKASRRLACSAAKAGGAAGEVRAVAEFLAVAV